MTNRDTDGRDAIRRFIHVSTEAQLSFRNAPVPDVLVQFGATGCTAKAKSCAANANGCKKQAIQASRLEASTGKLLRDGGMILTVREKGDGAFSACSPRVLPPQTAAEET